MASAYPLTGCSILVVEDEPLIAIEMAALLQTAGAEVFSARTLGEATALLERANLSAAIVDYGMGSEDTSTLCRDLVQRGIRFMFYTGYSHMQHAYPDAVVVQKPASERQLVSAMVGLVAPLSGSL
jgi:CheY-like chemotaxis protein